MKSVKAYNTIRYLIRLTYNTSIGPNADYTDRHTKKKDTRKVHGCTEVVWGLFTG